MAVDRVCSTCINLDKSKSIKCSKGYKYGCKQKEYIPCWIKGDYQLDELICGHAWMPNIKDARQVTIDEWLGE